MTRRADSLVLLYVAPSCSPASLQLYIADVWRGRSRVFLVSALGHGEVVRVLLRYGIGVQQLGRGEGGLSVYGQGLVD